MSTVFSALAKFFLKMFSEIILYDFCLSDRQEAPSTADRPGWGLLVCLIKVLLRLFVGISAVSAFLDEIHEILFRQISGDISVILSLRGDEVGCRIA